MRDGKYWCGFETSCGSGAVSHPISLSSGKEIHQIPGGASPRTCHEKQAVQAARRCCSLPPVGQKYPSPPLLAVSEILVSEISARSLCSNCHQPVRAALSKAVPHSAHPASTDELAGAGVGRVILALELPTRLMEPLVATSQ